MWADFMVMLQEMAVKLAEKHLRGGGQQGMQRKDAVSHFVLRLAYCRSAHIAWAVIERSCCRRWR